MPARLRKWLRRFRQEGAAGLEDRSSQPQRTPHATPAPQVTFIRQFREQHGRPGWAIARALRMPRSPVGAWRRLGLNRLPGPPPVPIQCQQPVAKPTRRSAGDPSRLNRVAFAPLIVALRSKYTGYSSLTRLVSRAPRRPRRSPGFHHRLPRGAAPWRSATVDIKLLGRSRRVGHRIHGIPGRLHRGRAGIPCRWRWTTIPGSPTSRSWATRRGPPVPPSWTEPSLGARRGRSTSIAS